MYLSNFLEGLGLSQILEENLFSKRLEQRSINLQHSDLNVLRGIVNENSRNKIDSKDPNTLSAHF